MPELASGGWRNPEVCKKYPGSGYLPFLQANPDIFSSGENWGGTHAKELQIVQEETNAVGFALLEKGARGAVLLCLESPLFAPVFYDQLIELKSKFNRQILFGSLGTDRAYFPSFDRTKRRKPELWITRKQKFCFVTSNKHFAQYQDIPGWAVSPSWQGALKHQLHNDRYILIDKLNRQKVLDLYGKGWPPNMTPLATEIPPGEKCEVMSQYYFGIAMENTIMPGYVTEKIIDCLVAGTVPVYVGAQDITHYVPQDCFIDLKKFQWPKGETAVEMIKRGQRFLDSELGDRFSYQAFAERLLKAIVPSA